MDAAIKPGAMADDSDEEDLEALRLAALQSIKSKPTVVAPRRRPKAIGRPNRHNFYRGCVNSNLISIVPMDNPLDQSELVNKVKADDPPPLILPQHRYCKTEVKSESAEKEPQVSTKFSRFEDSNSGDSDDDYDDEFDDKSSDSDHQRETAEKSVKAVADDPDADEDELLLQDEDSLGKFFNEMDEVLEEKDEVKSRSEKDKMRSPCAKVTSLAGHQNNPSGKVESALVKDNNSGCRDKEVAGDRPSLKGNVDNKTGIVVKRKHEVSENVITKETNHSPKDHPKDGSPRKALLASEVDDRRINQPCIAGRNRSPSPVRGKFQDHPEKSPSYPRKRNDSPLRRKPSPPSPGSQSPFYKRETQLNRLAQGKSSHPPRSLPSRNSPQDMTPPSYWGSRSNSNHGYPHAFSSREWSSSPHKWSGHPVPGSLSDPPRHLGSKNVSPSRQPRTSKSPLHRGSRVRRSTDRDWSTSPPRRRYKDFNTPHDSLRSSNDGHKPSRRKSMSPVRLGERSRYADKFSDDPISGRLSPNKKSSRRSRSRSPRFSPEKLSVHHSRSRSPRFSPAKKSSHRSCSRSPRFSPTVKSSRRSRSRSPRFSPAKKGSLRSRSRSPRFSPAKKGSLPSRSRSPRFSPAKKGSLRSRSRSPRFSPVKKSSLHSRSRSPRFSPAKKGPLRSRSRSPRFSPAKKSSRSPVRIRRSRSPVCSLSRTPSLSPSPDREGKTSVGSYRRHKSPLRLPGYRPPRLQDGRPFRQDGKVNRKDSERRVTRLNGPSRKPLDSRLEMSKVRPLSAKTESKVCEQTSEEKVECSAKEVVRDKSPINVPPPSSWSSDEDRESDSESRFKGTDAKGVQPPVTPPKPVQNVLLRIKDLKELMSPDKISPKKKKNKRTKKILSKSKEQDDSPKESKRLNDDDLRAELSRRRAERVNKAKGTNPSVPVRLVQSAFQSLTSKPNSADGERSTLKSYATKNDAGTELVISKKKPIHMRLGLPVARNPDPPELPSLANSLLPRISGLENTDGCDAEGGNNKWRKVKLKRSVTVEKSQSRGTATSNASGKEEQV